MSDLITATAVELSAAMAAGETTSAEITRAHLDRIAAVDGDLHAYLHVNADEALAAAADVDARRAAGRELPELAGVPIAVKDSIVTENQVTTCGSRMLEGWVPPYDATVVAKLRAAGLPILGKTNMDEFAMGSSTEFSAFGPTRNPWDRDRIPGGSGGGSAAAVAAYAAPLALGSDTGGSIRQPASVTGTIGVKPTYGSVSRYGLIAMASSLDQVGPCSRTVTDAALLHDLIAGHDPRDSTSLPDAPHAYATAARAGANGDLSGVRVGIVRELAGAGYAPDVQARFEESVALMEDAGAHVVEVACPSFEAALAAYYLIMPSEASSNLAKFDGMRFGLRVEPSEGPVTAERVMAATRGAGFGPEVKRRIVLGTYALSAGYYDAYYGSAQRVRTLVQRDLDAAFGRVDVIVSPTNPTTAFRFGEKVDDPMAMYLNDIATIPANLAGVPALSLPNGRDSDGLPTGFQLIGPARGETNLYTYAAALEARLAGAWGGTPLLTHVPMNSMNPTNPMNTEANR
ncbi:Asp-tRNA(Asn)/Glu-tRNA(Gln) amidotransferase subunit GatA [Pseudactinotalea sp. HY160]|uniref:Asp-tRNA(Asn)/Glu-tRNA(Gln) amidotransferase subunit GatA n=1 Tax=Pseudactinotalea sp. HY160 TaxID=2654490 RepID=UPI00128B5BD6|nr:Asp-tRNA(Asn)/Glu-tRNA(Gln) amidotransferase subunit GatA [Pseudactinotalea sp. HY160]MPV50331.1 Asp-tRNA(Asn)/Glu-tRNA(Gln) amidotransferase subunit GatA [Pseudactinotalea sp. HY160]